MFEYGWQGNKNVCQFQTMDALFEAIFNIYNNVPNIHLEAVSSGILKLMGATHC